MNSASVSVLIRPNIWKLYAIQALTQALFAVPIIVLFWQSHGLSLREILLVQSGFACTILVLEIPTGYLADRWGRKRTLVLAGCFDVLGYLIYANSSGFGQFLLAEMTIAVGVSLRSGALEALTYDTLSTLRQERTYRGVMGNQAFLEFNTEAFAGVIGAAVATISLRLPLWLTVIPATIALLIAMSLREPPRHMMHEERHWKAIWHVTVHTLFRHRGLQCVILLHGLISTMTLTFFWFFQSYQTLVGVPIVLFGLTHGIIVAAGAFSSKYVAKLERLVDDRLLLMGIATTVVITYLALGLPVSVWLLSMFLISRIAWGFLSPLTSDMVNRMTTSDVRATVLSLRSFLGRLIFVCTSSFVGALADARSISFALLIAGIVGGVLLLATFVMMRSVWRQMPA